MITLYSFGSSFNLIDPSPFVVKTHFLLTQSNIPFEILSGPQYLQKAPKGKLPFITDGDKTVADSFFIEQYIKQAYDFDINSHLSDQQKAECELLCAALEDRMYWYIVYFRWAYDANWQVLKDTLFSRLPFPLSKIVPKVARKDVLKALRGQGTSRHSQQEILQIAEVQLASMNKVIGDKPYFFNDQLSMADICAYSMLGNILVPSLPSPLQDLVKHFPNLVRYCENIHQTYYP
ncbi:glutathione S-transferase family protein [Alteromonas sp. 5E99-2]|uniref:glutathione S-transferase family protein n=1 Tax=Alteromonas sp. 5E99-2 TaxID=2817683 RepID=UPI001A97D681|nr:glutathione S-transferase family protein [Alteromonas sp. 5E99-2]MBO1256197.1 glutathione S-transferase family protein [Alteromonas sp. 5E99-2]